MTTDAAPPARWQDFDGLLSGAWSPGVLRDGLHVIAEGITHVTGFKVSSIAVLHDTGELETVAVAGSDAARDQLLGSFRPVRELLDDIALADDWGGLCFVPHERLEPGADVDGWVPDVAPAAVVDAWHPLDLLFVPLRDRGGRLRGVISVDLPLDGLRPGHRGRERLRRYVVQAARTIDALLERARLTEQVRLADATRSVVRLASARLDLERILSECQEEIVAAFGAQGMWIQAFDDLGRGRGAVYGGEVVLPDDLVQLAVAFARECWRTQDVGVLSGRRVPNNPVREQDREAVLAFLTELGVASLLFVPLGAGPECLGNLVLTRHAEDPEWSDVECAAALEIGHDLGRAVLNARLFGRERALLREVQALESYKSRLIATVSHELKNPLTAIGGHVELLEEAGLGDRASRSLAVIDRNARRLDALVQDLLTLSRAADPDRPVVAVPVDAGALVADAVELVALQAAALGVTVRIEAPPHRVLAAGDPNELDRVCANLVSNAVKYSRRGTTVTVRLAVRRGEVRLTVADEGIGISDEDRPEVFREFFRSADPAAAGRPGTGLGLAIVKRIVDRHHGSISVDSTPGVGSTFTVVLPRA